MLLWAPELLDPGSSARRDSPTLQGAPNPLTPNSPNYQLFYINIDFYWSYVFEQVLEKKEKYLLFSIIGKRIVLRIRLALNYHPFRDTRFQYMSLRLIAKKQFS